MDHIFPAHINDERLQTVQEHCENVSFYASSSAVSVHLSECMKLIGLLHDIGKNTEVFREYIKRAVDDPDHVHRGEINHSSAGGRWVAENLPNSTFTEKLTNQIISYAIISHHGLNDCLQPDGSDRYTARIYPERDIYYEEAALNMSSYLDTEYLKNVFSEAKDEVCHVLDKIKYMAEKAITRKQSAACFYISCLQRLMLSILIDADRKDTSEFMNKEKSNVLEDSERQYLWEDYYRKVLDHIRIIRNNTLISKVRTEISDSCESFAENGDGIYRLAVPTGGGKTLSGLRYALTLAKKLHKNHIFYVAPYLSILEQNASEIREILDDDEHILEHHSNMQISEEDGEDAYNYEQYIETWESPVILTTMVRFLDVLFGKSGSDIRRMHQLSDSIIILDEAQSVPVKTINLFNGMLNFLHNVCNSTIVLCTATQPVFEKTKFPLLYSEPADIIDNSKYTDLFRRVEFEDRTGVALCSEDMAELILKEMNRNILVILNTKAAVCSLAATLRSKTDIRVIQLTTYMCPQHRLDKIIEIKNILQKNEKLICVSTQLIEAGVNISFEKVVRSSAGLDSIIQAAGRCNRNGENQQLGKTIIVDCKEENLSHLHDIYEGQKAMYSVLSTYGNDLLSDEAIEGYYRRYFFSRINEMDFCSSKLGTTLYELLGDNKIGRKQYYLDHGKRAYKFPIGNAMKTAGELFSVIDSSGTVGVAVPYGKGAELIAQLKSSPSYYEKKRILKKMQRYTVSLSQNTEIYRNLYNRKAIEVIEDLGIITLSAGFYDEEIGVTDVLQLYVY